MPNILSQICAEKLKHVEACKTRTSFEELEQKIASSSAPRGFIKSIQKHSNSGKPAIIAEIKRYSPSKGALCKGIEVEDIAKTYESHGAACISVLTDIPYFKGSDQDLMRARKAVKLPVLRKDFMLDPYQILEARAIGADAILLIMAALEDKDAALLEKQAIALGLDVLIEVHDEEELKRALKLKSRLIGINNRNLKTLKIDLRTTEQLSHLVPSDRILVAESGIATIEDIRTLQKSGAKAFLIGETLMCSDDPGKMLSNLLI